MNKFLLLIITILLAAFLVIGLILVSTKMFSGPAKKATVRLNWLNQAQFAGIFVANEKGYYKENGLEVEIKEYEEGLNQMEELDKGVVDFSQISSQELISAISEGKNVKAVAVIYKVSPYAFASLKYKNIKSPSDFKGKILGASGGNDQAYITYSALLGLNGINSNQVTFKDLGFDAVDDIVSNNADVVDLYRTDQSYLLDKKGAEYNLIYPEEFGFEQYGDVITASNVQIDNDPNTTRAFVAATLKGWKFAIDNIEETIEILKKYENEQYKDEEHERYILTQSNPLIRARSVENLGEMNFIIWKRSYDAMTKVGLVKNDLNVENFYTNDFISENK